MSAGGFLVGSAVAGVGFGVAFLGAFRTLSALADPGERAEVIAGIFTVNYLAFGVPVLIAGVAVTRYGLHHTALVYLGVIAALAAAAASSMAVRKHPAGQRARASTDTQMQLAAVTGLCGLGRGTAQSLSWAAWTLGWRHRWGSFSVAVLPLWRRPLTRRGARRSLGAGVRRSLRTGTSWCASRRGLGRQCGPTSRRKAGSP
jgi:hypothetical protein